MCNKSPISVFEDGWKCWGFNETNFPFHYSSPKQISQPKPNAQPAPSAKRSKPPQTASSKASHPPPRPPTQIPAANRRKRTSGTVLEMRPRGLRKINRTFGTSLVVWVRRACRRRRGRVGLGRVRLRRGVVVVVVVVGLGRRRMGSGGSGRG